MSFYSNTKQESLVYAQSIADGLQLYGNENVLQFINEMYFDFDYNKLKSYLNELTV